MQTVRVLARPALSLLTASFLLAACGGGGNPVDGGPGPDAGGPDAGNVTIAFAHLVNGAPVVIGTGTPYTNDAGNAYGVTRVSYFVSDVTLNMQNGTKVAAPGAHYVDHDLAASKSFTLPAVAPAGAVSSISFVMGLTPALNKNGAFPSAPESLMEWPMMMGGGYHHLKFEGRFINKAGDPFNFNMHSGPLMGTDYSFAVSLDATGRMVSSTGATFTLEMNLEQWFTNPHVWDLNDYFTAATPGIMNNAAAQAKLKENGATVFTLGK